MFFAVQLLDDVGHGFVVAQRVEVVFVQSATAVGIDGIQAGHLRRSLL